MQKIKFYIPDFTNKLNINLALVESKKYHSECYYDNTEIASIFGSFPNAIWNGGRCEFGNKDLSRFQDIVGLVNSFGIAIRYTFTNCLIKEEHLHDEYCNNLMNICDNGMNEVLVNSPILEQYLRSNYPKFKYVLSTTTLVRGAKAINEACKKYDLVVADYRDLRNKKFLQDIIMRDKVEILLNESCVYECRYRSSHYKEISKAQLLSKETEEAEKCMYHDTSKFREAYISEDTLYNELVPLGYMNYKIRGRELRPEKLINEYLTYMVKPQYRDVIKEDIELLSTTTFKNAII